MSGLEVYRNPDEDIRESEQRDRELEQRQTVEQERGHGERAGVDDAEPAASGDEMDEDNDGGPLATS